MVSRGRGEEAGKDWEFGTNRCQLLHIAWRNNKVHDSTWNATQYPLINHSGKEHEKECIRIYK